MSASNGVRSNEVVLTQKQVECLKRGQELVRNGVMSKLDVIRHFRGIFRNAPDLTVEEFDRIVVGCQPHMAYSLAAI